MNDNNQKRIPPALVVKRLPRYFRYLRELINSGIERVSSASLSRKMRVNPSQIRQDFNYFGEFGKQGYGYNVNKLYDEISAVLGVTEGYTAVIIGTGRLGSALAGSPVFSKRGVRVVGLFDANEEVIGSEIYGIKVRHVTKLREFCRKKDVDIAVLTLPSEQVQDIIPVLRGTGIKASGISHRWISKTKIWISRLKTSTWAIR